jgi:ribosome silencing factor RsfS/YbeB/iojap
MNKTEQKTIESLISEIIETADSKKATNIQTYKTTNSWLTDYIVVLSANNNIHCKALLNDIDQKTCEFIKKNPSDAFYEHSRTSGTVESGWLIIDTNSILIHILLSDIRIEYAIDSFFEENSIIYHN